ITIIGVDASLGAADCALINVAGWLVKPDNGSQLVFTGGSITPGNCAACPPGGFPACISPVTCQAGVSFSYVVNQAAVNQPLSFTIAAGFVGVGSTQTAPATPGFVQFMPVASGTNNALASSSAAARGLAGVLVVHPSIAVSKQCVTNCAPFSSPYGSPI